MSQPIPTQPESLGPIKALGRIFGLVGVTVNVVSTALGTVDKTVSNIDRQLDKGFRAIDIATEGMLSDFTTDEVVNDANRTVRVATAKAEADAIIKGLKTK